MRTEETQFSLSFSFILKLSFSAPIDSLQCQISTGDRLIKIFPRQWMHPAVSLLRLRKIMLLIEIDILNVSNTTTALMGIIGSHTSIHPHTRCRTDHIIVTYRSVRCCYQ